MPLVRWICHALLVACCTLLVILPLAAQAQAPLWTVSVYGGGATTAGMTAAQIAAKPEASFTPFNPDTIHATGLTKNVWLRVRVSSEQEIYAQAWLIGISKAFADTVVLHTKASNGTWTSQAAGDWIAHRSWPVRSLAPQFFIPAQPKGSQDLYLEVRNRTPLRFDVALLSAPAAAIDSQNSFFLIGLSVGLMLLMAIASVVLALTYRHSAYAWYGAYVFFNIALSLSYSGLAAYALWPDATAWPEASITLLYMLAMLVQVQFYRVMFLSTADTPRWLQGATLAAIGVGLLTTALNFYMIEKFGSAAMFTLHIFMFTALCLALVVRQFRRGNISSWLYLLACLPWALVGFLAVLEHAGWMSLAWMPYNAPIYAFALEMPVLFAAMYLHSVAEHAKKVRKTTLATTDPSTGFVSSSQHMDTLTQIWDQSIDTQHDLVVAYVKVLYQLDAMSSIGRLGRVHSMERAVRLLRTVVREQDTVTHVDTDLFAILMPQLSLGDDVTNRLARLVALAVMTDQEAARHVPIRFRIAASSARSFSGSAEKLHASLKRKLAEADWGQRAIRYVRNIPSQSGRPSSGHPDETLSEFWRRAASEDNYPTTRQDGPAI
jgi:two-component system, sensor histidine kinase LadS